MKSKPVLFVDSNVLIEALFISNSAAFVIAEFVAEGTFDMATCALVIEDVERAILSKLANEPEALHTVIESWTELKHLTGITIIPDSDLPTIEKTFHNYIGVMRHKADIPVLAAAINMKPAPYAILSGNRTHFNDAVSKRCGIPIYSCQEFIDQLGYM